MVHGRYTGNCRSCSLWAAVALLAVLAIPAWAGSDPVPPDRAWKILHLMSYHSPWKWPDDQFKGFKSAMAGLNIQYKIGQMDTKRSPSRQAVEAAGKKARHIIDTWQPDLVYASDDCAMNHVVKYYVNTPLPFVFSGVNLPPEKYGFTGSSNVTGILEQEHFVETVALLKQMAPDVERIAVIFDQGPTWQGVRKRMEENLPQVPDIRVTSWNTIKTFSGYKSRIRQLQREADAIALLGIFTFTDDSGKTVPYTEVLRWTADNSRLPDFSFWKDRIPYGTLCTVTVSGFEQGYAAGQMARRILIEGLSPQTLAMHPSVKGEPVISLARAKKLGIRARANLLLTADVITEFEWDR